MYTYIVKDRATGLYKIGKTTNFTKRFSVLSTANINLEKVVVFPDNKEKFFHQFFKNKRVEREWYRLTDEDIKDVEEYIYEIAKENII